MGWVPRQTLPRLRYRPEARRQADEAFGQVRARSEQLFAQLPTNYEALKQLHGR
jgi:tryptophan halogenase